MSGIPQQHNFPPPPIQNIQHNIQNVTPRLPGVPENNRIFVDGKAYEVFYLDQTAVIERNGLPHRVSFAGPARNVTIDGTPYCMSFGEQKQVLIDGEIHLLRFGGPSRELYMGNFPFKGAFGGPPINATINGRRHEIRLCGPPPEVRIDPEPSYELMRYMPAIRQQQIIPQQRQIPQQPKVEAKKDPVLDVTSLLQRLKNSGILSQLNQFERKNHERQAAIEARNTTLGRSNSPPVPCAHRFEHLERRAMPMAGFDLFSMRSLIIRYDSVIDSIHKQRHCCQDCGIGIKELYSEQHQQHAQFHLNEEISKYPKTKDSPPKNQPWFMLDVSDKSQQRQSSPGGTDDLISKDATSSSQGGQQSTNDNACGVDADSVENKECCVCHERFEEYWVDDEDVWRLRDSVVVDGKAFHTYCRDDAAAMSSSFTTINDDK
uniref:Polyadenylation and cleavage factor homolog 11 n=1 Tax=Meloidogyne floridensis TaxID=298350 RepID=A0A915NMF1_9BILA